MHKTLQWFAERRRALIATAVAVAVSVREIGFTADAHWYSAIAVAVLGAIGVYLVPDIDPVSARWVKPTVAALMVGSQAAVQAAGDGINGYEWVSVAVAVAGALGIAVVPNRPTYMARASRGYLRDRSTG